MPWLLLSLAIILEVAGTTSMKVAHGFEHVLPSVLVFVFYACSFSVMMLALKGLELSVAYAVWAGVGTALVAVIGALWFGESMTPIKVGSIGLIVLGVIGLQAGG